MAKYDVLEFENIIKHIVEHNEFQKTKDITHHGITRYDHCLRVAYYTYKMTKFLNLDYKKATEAAMLHDFFIDEVKHENGIVRLRKHPEYAVTNAKKYFNIDKKQEDIIRTHMFPVTFTPPKYIESWLVDLLDDFAAIYERTYTTKNELKAATTFLFLVMVNFIKIRL